MSGLGEAIHCDDGSGEIVESADGEVMSVLSKYSPLKIGWRVNAKGELEPIDEQATARYSESLRYVRSAYLQEMRDKGYLPPVSPAKGSSS